MFTKTRIFALAASTAGILALGAPLASAASADVAPNSYNGYGNSNTNGNGSGTDGSANYGAYSGITGFFPGYSPTPSCGNSANGSNPGGASLGNDSGGGGGGGNETSGCDTGGLIQDTSIPVSLGS